MSNEIAEQAAGNCGHFEDRSLKNTFSDLLNKRQREGGPWEFFGGGRGKDKQRKIGEYPVYEVGLYRGSRHRLSESTSLQVSADLSRGGAPEVVLGEKGSILFFGNTQRDSDGKPSSLAGVHIRKTNYGIEITAGQGSFTLPDGKAVVFARQDDQASPREQRRALEEIEERINAVYSMKIAAVFFCP